MTCDRCNKETPVRYGDWNLPVKDRQWLCQRCYYPSRIRTKHKKNGRISRTVK